MVTVTKVDVANANEVDAWIEETYNHFKRLDGGANVAGVAGGDGSTTVATTVRAPA